MASPARDARLKAAAEGFTEIVERGRGHLVTRNPATGKYCIDTQAGGAGWHYGAEWTNEVDTTWEVDTGAWQYKMVKAEFQLHARNVLNAGDVIQWLDPTSGESVTLQPLALNWVDNATDSRQQITQPQAVTAAVDGDVLSWQNGYGTGRHFRYQADTAQLIKHLTIDSIANLPAPTVSNPYLELEFILKRSAGVTLYVDGVAWDNSTKTATANAIEFRLSNGTTVWSFAKPQAFDSGDSRVNAIFQLRRQGNTRYCTVRIPKTWIDGAVFPITLDPTIDIQIGASTNDGEFGNTSTYSSTNAYERLGNISGELMSAWNRYPGVTITAGATITAAYIELLSRGNYSSDSPVMRVYAEDADNPSAPSDRADALGRTRTTAYAAWTIESWSNNTWYGSSVDLSSVIQELVDSYTISSDAIQIFIDCQSATGFRSASTYDDASSDAPKLHIEYTEGGATVALGTATATATPIPLANVDAPVSRTLATAAATVTGIALSVSAPPPSATVTLNTATATATGIPAALDAPVTRTMGTGTATATPIPLTVDAPIAIILSTAALTATGIATTPDAPVSVSLNTASLTGTPITLSVDAPITRPLATGALTATGIPLTISAIPPGTTVTLSTASLTGTGIGADIVPGVVSKTLATAQATATPIPLTVSAEGGAQSVSLDTASITATPVNLDVIPGTASVTLSTASATATGIGTTVSVGGAPQSVGLDTASIAATGIPFEINQTVILDAGAVTVTGIASSVLLGTLYTSLDTASLTATSIGITIEGGEPTPTPHWRPKPNRTGYDRHLDRVAKYYDTLRGKRK